jgi:hypothetical protein
LNKSPDDERRTLGDLACGSIARLDPWGDLLDLCPTTTTCINNKRNAAIPRSGWWVLGRELEGGKLLRLEHDAFGNLPHYTGGRAANLAWIKQTQLV